MATEKECPLYKTCGFVRWRVERPYAGIVPLPENGDCGIDPNICARLNPLNPTNPEEFGAANTREFDVALPANISSSNPDKKHRIITGTDR